MYESGIEGVRFCHGYSNRLMCVLAGLCAVDPAQCFGG